MKKVLIVSMIVLYGCSPEIRTYSDSDKEYPVQNYRTYQWARENKSERQSNPLCYNELTDKRIKGSGTGAIMFSKGGDVPTQRIAL
jgi:hypothetical protein